MRKRWTRADLAARALNYMTREDFRTGPDGPAYQAALRRGRDFLDTICAHMKPQRRVLTYELVAEIASEHCSRTAFFEADAPAYTKARLQGWLEVVCAHMEPQFVSWTEEKILALVPHCRNRQELKNFGGASYAARALGIYTKVEQLLPSERESWVEPRIAAEALLYERRVEFQKGCPSAYAAMERLGVKNKICAHMEEPLASRSFEDLCEIAGGYSTPTEFLLGDQAAYKVAQDRGLLDKVLDAVNIDSDRIAISARGCRFLSDFYFRHRPCYRYAKRHGFLDDVILLIGPDFEETRRIAEGYNGRMDFRDGNLAAYRHAAGKGWLDDLFEPLRGICDPNALRLLYVYLYEWDVYIGITIDDEMRHKKHLGNSAQPIRQLASKVNPRIFCRPDHDGLPRPHYMERRIAERFERIMIHRFARAGYKVLNKRHNPQFDWVSRKWTWQVEV